MKKLILTVLTLCFVLLTAMTALADQKKISRADIAKILNRPDIMEAEDVITHGNKIVIIDWGVDENNHRYLEAISLPADKVRNIGNKTREYDTEDSGQDDDYHPHYRYVDNNQTDTEETDPYLKKIGKAVDKIKDSQSMNDVIAAKDMLMSVKWDVGGSYGGICENEAARLLGVIANVPNVYSIHTNLIYYATQQSATVNQRCEVFYLTRYIRGQDKENAGEAIDFLNSLLDAEWQNPEAKERTVNKIKESIKELKELQEK